MSESTGSDLSGGYMTTCRHCEEPLQSLGSLAICYLSVMILLRLAAYSEGLIILITRVYSSDWSNPQSSGFGLWEHQTRVRECTTNLSPTIPSQFLPFLPGRCR